MPLFLIEGLLGKLGVIQPELIEENYRERLDYEISVIDEMGFPTYFLVVWDYIRFAKEQGIPVELVGHHLGFFSFHTNYQL